MYPILVNVEWGLLAVTVALQVVLLYLIGHAKRERAYLRERGRVLDAEIARYNGLSARLWESLKRTVATSSAEQADIVLSGPPWDYADPEPFEEPQE